MKFTIQVNKNFSYTATSLDSLTKEREQQFRLMLWMKAKEMTVNNTKLKLK